MIASMWLRMPWVCVCGLSVGGLQIGCGSSGVRMDSSSEESVEVLGILREHHGVHARLRRPVRLVIRDRATFHQLPLPEVEVDFGREMLLVVAAGGLRTTTYAPRITGVRRVGNMLVVDVIRARRSDDAGDLAPGRTAFYHMVVVPRSDLNVAQFDTTVAPDLFDSR